MNAHAFPLPEVLPATPGTATTTATAADELERLARMDAAGNPRAAADFAALLQNAGLAADAPAAGKPAEVPVERPSEGVAAHPEGGSALDGLLFLAALQGPVLPSVPTLRIGVAPRGPGASTPPAPARVASASPADPRMPNAEADLPALAAGIGASEPAVHQDLERTAGAPAQRATFESIDDTIRAAATASTRHGSNRPFASEAAAPPIVAPSMDTTKSPTLDKVAADSRAVATTVAEPATSLVSSTGPASPAPLVVEIDTPLQDAGWRLDAAGRIASLVTRGIEHAELRITPPDLGPVELRIDVRGGEATLAIVATQATTRDALETALPLLRDMLAQHGLSLGQATVQDGRGHQAPGSGREPPHSGAFATVQSSSADDRAATPRDGIVRQLIDVFV